MKKILMLIVGAVMMLAMLIPAPAFAAQSNHHCIGTDTGAGGCVDMTWHAQADGSGYILDSIHLYFTGDKSCLDGSSLTASVIRSDGTSKYSTTANLGPGNGWDATRSPDLAVGGTVHERVNYSFNYSGCSGHPAGTIGFGGNDYYDFP